VHGFNAIRRGKKRPRPGKKRKQATRGRPARLELTVIPCAAKRNDTREADFRLIWAEVMTYPEKPPEYFEDRG